MILQSIHIYKEKKTDVQCGASNPTQKDGNIQDTNAKGYIQKR